MPGAGAAKHSSAAQTRSTFLPLSTHLPPSHPTQPTTWARVDVSVQAGRREISQALADFLGVREQHDC